MCFVNEKKKNLFFDAVIKFFFGAPIRITSTQYIKKKKSTRKAFSLITINAVRLKLLHYGCEKLWLTRSSICC